MKSMRPHERLVDDHGPAGFVDAPLDSAEDDGASAFFNQSSPAMAFRLPLASAPPMLQCARKTSAPMWVPQGGINL